MSNVRNPHGSVPASDAPKADFAPRLSNPHFPYGSTIRKNHDPAATHCQDLTRHSPDERA